MTFPYFTDPLNFAYLRDDACPCSICGARSTRLDGAHFSGATDIDAICFQCLQRGALIERGISTNSVNQKQARELLGDEAAEKLSNVIVYCTPKLPCWQDRDWPIVDGDFATFVKIAAEADFLDQKQFTESILPGSDEEPDPEWLWAMLPDHPVTNIKEGQYDVTIYLFRRGDKLVSLWDTN